MNWDKILKYIAGFAGFALWAYLAINKYTSVDALVDLLKVALGGLVVHLLQNNSDSVPPLPKVEPPAVPPAQAGFATLKTLLFVIVASFVLAALFGCAAVPQSVVETKKMSDDNVVSNLKLLVCNLSVQAVLRHPEIQQFVSETCRPYD